MLRRQLAGASSCTCHLVYAFFDLLLARDDGRRKFVSGQDVAHGRLWDTAAGSVNRDASQG